MQYRRHLTFIVCQFPLLVSGILSEPVQELSTDFTSMTEKFCPSGYGVSNLIVHKGQNQYGEQDFRLTLKCVQLIDSPDKAESCKTKYAITLPHFDMDFGDELKTCGCNEYLAGIKTYPYELKDNGVVIARERRIHLRCCAIPSSLLNLGPCQFTGMRYLLSPWDTELKAQLNKGNENGVIQSLMLFGDYIVAKSCIASASRGAGGYPIPANDDCHTKDIKTGRCNMMLRTPFQAFGRTEWTFQNATDHARAADKNKDVQVAVCKDGHYLANFRLVDGKESEKCAFEIDCKPLTYHYCYCFWSRDCSSLGGDWYLSGWKSDWRNNDENRSIEFLCCTSPAVKIGRCKERRYDSNPSKTPTTIDKNPYGRKRRDVARVFKNAKYWWEHDYLQVSFEVCDVQVTEDKGCQEPCKSCDGTTESDLICNPNQIAPSTFPATTTEPSTPSTAVSVANHTNGTSPLPQPTDAATVPCNLGTTIITPSHSTAHITAPPSTPPRPTSVPNTTPGPTNSPTSIPKPTTPPHTTPKATTLPPTTTIPPTTLTLKATTPSPTTIVPTTPPPTPKPSTPSSASPRPTTPEPTTPKPDTPKASTPPPTTSLPATTTTTPTRPTCSATRIDGGDFCKTKLPPGANATVECKSHCYAADRGHYRGACCIPGLGENRRIKKLACQCLVDPCRNSMMDIVFLLDSSGSLEDWGFKEEVDFIRNFVSRITLGLKESRVALVQFSTGAKRIFSFTDPVQSQDGVNKRLDGLDYDAGDTNITAAFVEAKPILATTKRPGVPQVIVLVTDGIHNQGRPPPTVPAEQLRTDGVLIYAVGIGPEASRNHLILITGQPSNVFMAQFSDLNNVLYIIGAEVTATVNS